MAKLITYVDTAEAVSAAAQSGADEIYVTVAAPPVKGVSPGSLEGAARFCRAVLRALSARRAFAAPSSFAPSVRGAVLPRRPSSARKRAHTECLNPKTTLTSRTSCTWRKSAGGARSAGSEGKNPV